MSWGGRWQKGLSHQACVASDSEQGEDQSAQGSGLSLQLPASRASQPPWFQASRASRASWASLGLAGSRGGHCSPLLPSPHPLQGAA